MRGERRVVPAISGGAFDDPWATGWDTGWAAEYGGGALPEMDMGWDVPEWDLSIPEWDFAGAWDVGGFDAGGWY